MKAKKRSLVTSCAAIAALALVACGVSDAPTSSDEGHLGQERAALTPEEIAARKDAIRAYFQQRVASLPTIATTTTSGGTVIDWVRPADLWPSTASVPPTLKPGAIPKAGGNGPSVKGAVDTLASSELQVEPSALGPAGTVPIVRFNVEHYLSTVVVPPARPQDIYLPPGLPQPKPEDDSGRYHVTWQHVVKALGTDGVINIWNGAGPKEAETNIAQVNVYSDVSGTVESVEAGKIEAPYLTGGSSDPFFFTYFTNNGYQRDEDWAGGYNTTVSGWHQVSRIWAPGERIVAWSTDGGDQRVIHIEVRQNATADWWVAVNGEWLGYYPRCVHDRSDCADGQLYRTTGLRTSADQVLWYGEVADQSPPAATSTAMGSGTFAAKGFGHAAYLRAMAVTTDNKVGSFLDLSPPLGVTDANCYSGAGPAGAGDATWPNFFFYGGPGTFKNPACQ